MDRHKFKGLCCKAGVQKLLFSINPNFDQSYKNWSIGKFWRKYVKWKLKHEENTNNDSQDFHQTLENYLPSDLH